MRAWRVGVALMLILAGAFLSAVLLMQHHGETSGSSIVLSICGAANGCEAVNHSSYSALGGVPIAALGLLFYLSLALLITLSFVGDESSRRASLALALMLLVCGMIVDGALLGIQYFVIKSFCRLCLITYFTTALPILLLFPERRFTREWRSLAQSTSVRIIGVAWLLGSAILAYAVGMSDQALRLMAWMPRSTASNPDKPVEKLSIAEARRELRHLRRVLDDPSALNEYLAQRRLQLYEQAPQQTIDLSNAALTGRTDAPIEIAIFSDFLCPWCRRFALAFAEVAPQLSLHARIAFLNYPLDKSCNADLAHSLHPSACLLALGSVCAQSQGRFWAFHDRTFSSEMSEANESDVLRIAAEIRLDKQSFENCLRSSKARHRLQSQIAEARRLGVDATPTVFVNGRRLANAMDLLLVFEHALKRRGIALPSQNPS